jgi:Plasmid pRiA4b ORF-3-like protein
VRRRRCPTEDCRGIGGFGEFLAAIADPQHDEHEAMLSWAGGAYGADEFDPATVRFDDPAKRLRMATE